MSQDRPPLLATADAEAVAVIICDLRKVRTMDTTKISPLGPQDLIAADAIFAVTRDAAPGQVAEMIARLCDARSSVGYWLLEHKKSSFEGLAGALWLARETQKAAVTR